MQHNEIADRAREFHGLGANSHQPDGWSVGQSAHVAQKRPLPCWAVVVDDGFTGPKLSQDCEEVA